MPHDPDPGSHRREWWKWWKGVKITLSVIIILGTISILIIKLFVEPQKPSFTLLDVRFYDFNLSCNTSTLNSSLQVTILSQNRDPRIGIYYESLDLYATYQDQEITSRTAVPNTYGGHNSSLVWTQSISGRPVMLPPAYARELSRDWDNGEPVRIMIQLSGQVRWKMWKVAKGQFHVTVKCRVPVTKDLVINAVIKMQLEQTCIVNYSR